MTASGGLDGRAITHLERRMEECVEMDDYEIAHSRADEILCETLRELGFNRLVDLWMEVPKWYA